VWFVLHGFGQLAGYFIRDFAPLDDGTRLIVAPEALSRFYLGETTGAGSGDARVGATWMTREDRLTEIADYVGYLDALYAHVFTLADRGGVTVVALGFSQGVATACRWVARGSSRIDRLVLWAGLVPPEIEGARDAAPFRALHVTRVLGLRDEYATPELVRAEDERLAALGIAARLVRFDGGHELHAKTLQALAE
jgi:predicted esterase